MILEIINYRVLQNLEGTIISTPCQYNLLSKSLPKSAEAEADEADLDLFSFCYVSVCLVQLGP